MHYSWFVIAMLITLSLAGQFTRLQLAWPPALVWTAAAVTALLFFITLLLHELSHAIVARQRRLQVRGITLFALGGVAEIEGQAESAGDEFWIAIVGPLTSICIGLTCLSVASFLGWRFDAPSNSAALVTLAWLGYINLALAVFNLIPAYPLDGGRVLRAILWKVFDSGPRASGVAAVVGQVAAVGFILLGLLRFFAGADLSGLWLAFIGWFLLQAAQGSQAEVALTEGLQDVRVRDLMSQDCATAQARWSVKEFVDDVLLRSGRRCFLVLRDDTMVGLITPAEVRRLRREDWPTTPVGAVARPLESLYTVSPGTPAVDALRLMVEKDVHQLPVMSAGHFEGIITRAHVLQLIDTRKKLGQTEAEQPATGHASGPVAR